MITAKTNFKEIQGDITKLRKALGVTSEQQGRELAASCCYVAARMSYPQNKGKADGGATITAATGKAQEKRILATMHAYTVVTDRKTQTSEDSDSLVKQHPNRVRVGIKIQPAKRIAAYKVRHTTTSRRNFAEAFSQIAKHVGWNKAAWIGAMLKVYPQAKQRIVAYVRRHVGSAPSSVNTQKQGDKWAFTMSNLTRASQEVFGSAEYAPAANAAAMGQTKRYEAKIKSLIKEARLS